MKGPALHAFDSYDWVFEKKEQARRKATIDFTAIWGRRPFMADRQYLIDLISMHSNVLYLFQKSAHREAR